MPGPCYLRLANGWTVSLSEDDTPPALCSVAAWPTAKHDQKLSPDEWFSFGEGRVDQRCWTLDDVRKALVTVANAPDA